MLLLFVVVGWCVHACCLLFAVVSCLLLFVDGWRCSLLFVCGCGSLYAVVCCLLCVA